LLPAGFWSGKKWTMKTQATERVGFNPNYQRVVIVTVRLAAVIAASEYPTVQGAESPPAAQWNIMVVPANQTAFSGEARERFEKNCASCHSKDGRAQTPVARQRHVQDLSECTLPDDKIVQQILQGTHGKTVDFKMPPFNEKLSRAEVESLVPLVKAFRPVPPSPSEPNPGNVQSDNPRLVGIVSLAWCRYAVLEKARSSGRYFMLREKESHDGVTLLKIRWKEGMVKLGVGGTNPEVSLTLDDQVSRPKRKGLSGFLDRLGETLADAPPRLVLHEANTDLVLFLYSQFTGRTLIRSPRLPASTFDLDVGAAGPETAAQRLKRALAARGITTIEDGEKFLLVVPTSEVSIAKPRSPEIRSLASDDNRSESFPGGAFINFPNTELSQVVKFYSDLTGRSLDQAQRLPSNCTVNFTTQTALSAEECAYALETLLGWHGLKVVAADGEDFKSDPVVGAKQ